MAQPCKLYAQLKSHTNIIKSPQKYNYSTWQKLSNTALCNPFAQISDRRCVRSLHCQASGNLPGYCLGLFDNLIGHSPSQQEVHARGVCVDLLVDAGSLTKRDFEAVGTLSTLPIFPPRPFHLAHRGPTGAVHVRI